MPGCSGCIEECVVKALHEFKDAFVLEDEIIKSKEQINEDFFMFFNGGVGWYFAISAEKHW